MGHQDTRTPPLCSATATSLSEEVPLLKGQGPGLVNVLWVGAHTPTQFLYVHHLWPLALKFQQPWPLALKFGLLVAHSGRCTKLFTFWVRHAHALSTKQSVKPL